MYRSLVAFAALSLACSTQDVGPYPVTECDQDGDGALDPRCGGNDCCAIDPQALPGSDVVSGDANNCGTFDYNCDGKETKAALENVTCKANCALGFSTPVACGEEGPYVTNCQPAGAGECLMHQELATMECR